MLIAIAAVILQTAVPPPSAVVTPGPPGPRISGGRGPTGSPAANEIVTVGDLRISNGHVLTFGPGIPARAGFFIANNGDASDRLLGVTSPDATRVRLTQSTAAGEVDVDTVEIAPHSRFSAEDVRQDFNRGRIQMRLDDLRAPTNPADGVVVTLEFERAGRVTARVFPFVTNP